MSIEYAEILANMEFFSKEFCRLKRVEEEFNKIKNILEIIQERNMLDRSHQVTFKIHERNMTRYGSILDAFRKEGIIYVNNPDQERKGAKTR